MADKNKALEDKLRNLYKNNSLVKLTDKPLSVEAVSTGSLDLDLATGVGGWPRGRIIELYGAKSSGKTTLALHSIKAHQQAGLRTAFIDSEHALDPVYAERIGVDLDAMEFSQPNTGEEALDIIHVLSALGKVDFIVVDSVATMVPQSELDSDLTSSPMALQARMMSRGMQRIVGPAAKNKCTILFINQTRSNIGGYGSYITTPGGNALGFYTTMQAFISNKGKVSLAGTDIGIRSCVELKKNKVAPPFKKAEFDIIWGRGISRAGEIVEIAVDKGIIIQSGSWFSYREEKIGQGKQNVVNALEHNPELMSQIEAEIHEAGSKSAKSEE